MKFSYYKYKLKKYTVETSQWSFVFMVWQLAGQFVMERLITNNTFFLGRNSMLTLNTCCHCSQSTVLANMPQDWGISATTTHIKIHRHNWNTNFQSHITTISVKYLYPFNVRMHPSINGPLSLLMPNAVSHYAFQTMQTNVKTMTILFRWIKRMVNILKIW